MIPVAFKHVPRLHATGSSLVQTYNFLIVMKFYLKLCLKTPFPPLHPPPNPAPP